MERIKLGENEKNRENIENMVNMDRMRKYRKCSDKRFDIGILIQIFYLGHEADKNSMKIEI